MSVPRARRGETVAFADAARTSVRTARQHARCTCDHDLGDVVIYRGEECEVIHNAGHVGLDGTHWIRVRELASGWKVHVPCSELARKSSAHQPVDP